jgi:hypothetical protein
MQMYNHFDFDEITSTKGTYQLADANGLSRFAAIGGRVAGQHADHRTTSDHHKFTYVLSTASFSVFHPRHDVRAIIIFVWHRQTLWQFAWFDGFLDAIVAA